MPKIGQFLAGFWKTEACSQTVLPDRSILILGQKLVENAKIENFKCDNFQTLWLWVAKKYRRKIDNDDAVLLGWSLPSVGGLM